MHPDKPRLNKKVLVLTSVPVLLAISAAAVFLGQPRQESTAAVAASTTGRISRIDLDVGLSDTMVTREQIVQAHFLITLRGGPGPVTFGAQWPRPGGGTYAASFTMVLDRDAVYGADIPMPIDVEPGVYNIVVKAQSFENAAVSCTRTIRLTVRPMGSP